MLRFWVLIGSLAVAAPLFAHDFWSNGEAIADWTIKSEKMTSALAANVSGRPALLAPIRAIKQKSS